MTPAEHLAEAERLLGLTIDTPDLERTYNDQAMVTQALTHAVIAVAAELGVPHNEATTGGGPGAAQAQGS